MRKSVQAEMARLAFVMKLAVREDGGFVPIRRGGRVP